MRSFLTVCLAAFAVVAGADVNKEAIAKVKAGELTEARASWWGFDPADSTEALQAAIDSGARRLIVEDMGTPWIVTPITGASDQEIVFEKGVVVEAKTGEFRGSGDCLFRIALKKNVSLIGYGAILRMRRQDYTRPPYEKSEHRMALDIRSCSNVRVFGLTLAESGGDGIYVGTWGAGGPNKNIHIKDVVCDRNYRQGISVISAEDLLIENTVMSNTAGTPPQAGIDFEPNRPTQRLVNCVMRNCVSENNRGSGYLLGPGNLNGRSTPISLRLENCVARGSNLTAFHFGAGDGGADGPLTGLVEMIDCTFAGGRGPAILISKPVSSCRLEFVNCRIENVPAGKNINPIAFMSATDSTADIGGVVFKDCIVEDFAVDRPVARYDDWTHGGLSLVDVAGTLRVRRKETTHTFTREWLDTECAGRRYKRFPKYETAGAAFEPADRDLSPEKLALRPFSVRGSGTFALYAEAGDDVAFELGHLQVGSYKAKTMAVTARTPSGEEITLGEVPFRESAPFSFRAPETGVYRIPVSAGPNRMEMVSANRPACVSGESGAIDFIVVTGDFYFYVPEGTREFGVKISNDQLESVSVTIYDPAGNEVWKRSAITVPEQFVAAPDENQTGKPWKVVFKDPVEDFAVELQGIPPFLSCNPATLLRPTP